jgi:hypothetical protein
MVASTLVAAICGIYGSVSPMGAQSAFAQEAVRPEVGKPLQAAQELMKAQKFKDAAAKVREAEAVAGKTANESFLIERMRGSVAAAGGDYETATKSFETLIASGKLPPAEQLKVIEALAGAAYRAKDYKKAASWATRYTKEGGTNPQIHTLATQSLYLSGDFVETTRQLQAEIQAADQAGKTPSEERLQMLANAQLRTNDNAGYVATLERLVSTYPKKQYWADLISRLRRKPGFSDRFSLDVYRLQFATGNLTTTADYMEAVQLSLQAGATAEAKQLVDSGFDTGALGKSAEAERHKRLKDLTYKKFGEQKDEFAKLDDAAIAAKENAALLPLGYALVVSGQAQKGIAVIEKAIAKGELKRPEDAKLQLGLAYAQAGQKAKAIQVLKTVKGADGVGDLARLWSMQIGR